MKGKNVSKKKTNNKDKRNMILGIAMMVFAVTIDVGTYEYYQTTITGTVSGTILAWDCKDGNISVSSVDLSALKPGSAGNFTFNILSANFKTDVTVKLKYTGSVPGNFKLYKGTTTGTTIAMSTAYPAAGSEQFSVSGVNKNSQTSFTVHYDWPYGTASETPLYTSSNGTFTIDYEIVCTQSATQ